MKRCHDQGCKKDSEGKEVNSLQGAAQEFIWRDGGEQRKP
jgi:hypothetical protein